MLQGESNRLIKSDLMKTTEQGSSESRDRPLENPFNLNDDAAYRSWRDHKLSNYPPHASDIIVEIDDLTRPSGAERADIIRRCRWANMAIYAIRQDAQDERKVRRDLRVFAGSLGLCHLESHRSAAEDGIVALEVAYDDKRHGYIPYTNRPLTWHTDGYYNEAENCIRAFLLHCVRDAEAGGENSLLDPEIAYIRLRDENPDFITALMHPDAMTIPENREASGKVRPVSRGPVFSIDPETISLHMRYSARSRNIIWRKDRDTQAAVSFLSHLLAGSEPLMLKHKFAPGQGLICNNVLHARSGFDNGGALAQASNRLLFRMRYQDRIAETCRMTVANH